MKIITYIAGVELKKLFYSPIAWLLLILFLIQTSLAYIGQIERLIGWQESGLVDSSLTYHTFADQMLGGIFIRDVLNNLFLYIPLITMSLMSRETSSGTIKLLYSSPVKITDIILGKYSAMLVFNLFMILMLAIIVIFSGFHIASVDVGMLLSSLIGFYLLLSAYASIGLFMSCLSSYQVVAAIATFGAFAFLNFIGDVWQDYAFFRAITNYLSISNRAEDAISGILSTKNVIYYLSITFIFLSFSWLKLRSNRKTIAWPKLAINYITILTVGVAVIYFASKPGWIGYFDMTQDLSNTVSENVQETLKKMDDGPLEITTYINLLDLTYWRLRPTEQNKDKRMWESYQRFKPNISFKYVYYYDSSFDKRVYRNNPGKTLDEIAERNARAYNIRLDRFKKPDEIRKEINLFPENNRLVRLLTYKQRSTFLRTFNDNIFWPLEEEIGAALRRLTSSKVPNIAFLEGEEERAINKAGDRHYELATKAPNVRASLMNQGVNAINVSLNSEEIPKDILALIIADPRADISERVLEKINKYIDEGGNLFLAGEPGKQSVLNPILKRIGVQLMDGILVQGDQNFSPDEIKSYVTAFGEGFGKKIRKLSLENTAVITRGVVALQYDSVKDFEVHPLLQTDKEIWNKTSNVVLDSAAVEFDPTMGDVKKSYATALALTRKINGKEQRILVTGDADFLSNIELAKFYPRTGNGDFFQGFLGWFSYGEFPIDTKRPDPTLDNKFKIKGDRTYITRWVMVGIIPAILIIIGAIILIRRKRK